MSEIKMRSFIRRLIPEPILERYRKARALRQWKSIRKEYGELSVADAFTRIYRQKMWGNPVNEKFFSGGGSLEHFGGPYAEAVNRFIAERGIKTVVDLGCGDFRIGRRICEANQIRYIGVDIVPDLIAHNTSKFAGNGIEFKCVNIIDGQLPDGQLCLIRQVLQHMSNGGIAGVLANCSKFPFLLVTEDVYSGKDMQPNLDVKHGPDNRLFRKSGVYLDLPPFNLKTEKILEIPCLETHSIITTWCIEKSKDTKA
jgi:SAM-dependent methyltransferase